MLFLPPEKFITKVGKNPHDWLFCGMGISDLIKHFLGLEKAKEADREEHLKVGSTWIVFEGLYRPWVNRKTGEPGYFVHEPNLVVDTGRVQVAALLLGMSGAVNFVAHAVGEGTTNPDNADTRLETELIGNATRIALTDSAGSTLDTADITNDTSVSPFRKKVIAQAIYPATDGNDGETFSEHAIASTTTLPGSPTGTSGVIYNRFEPTSALTKTNGVPVTVSNILRF